MLPVLIHGSRGRMGQTLIALAPEEEIDPCACLDQGEEDQCESALSKTKAVIDFSVPEASARIVQLAATTQVPVVIGTTGHSESQRALIVEASKKIPILWAGNYSVGVTLLLHLAEETARILGDRYDPEILEWHHRHKKDAPSGTALNLAEAVQNATDFAQSKLVHGREGQTGERSRQEIGMHAIRGGEIVGEHTVFFIGPNDRIELTHRASDRRIFASGALQGARWIQDRAPGIYSMRDVLGLNRS